MKLKRTSKSKGPLARPLNRGRTGFTLVELLTVIAIVGLLAGVTLGVTKLAGRKSKEKRMEAELQTLISKIEAYNSNVGYYPPDNPDDPAINQLYYELSGTTYDTETETFRTADRQSRIGSDAVRQQFQADGFANTARAPGDIPYRPNEPFSPEEYKPIQPDGDIHVLVVPIDEGPNVIRDGVNPWNYVSNDPENNPVSYDLWADVVIGDQVVRFSNWSRDPLTLK